MDTKQNIREVLARAASKHVPLPSLAARRALRLSAQLTEEELAKLVGVNRVSVARWELGRREPRGDVRQRYAEVLKGLQEQLELA
jgi:DNA-binding transcriptional regulator YiaG